MGNKVYKAVIVLLLLAIAGVGGYKLVRHAIQKSHDKKTEVTTEVAKDVTETTDADEADSNDAPSEEASNIDELAYKDEVSDEDAAAFREFLESQPDIDEDTLATVMAQCGLDYEVDNKGNFLVPLSRNSLVSTDATRPRASVEMGLNSNPIDDAVSFPFNLSSEQVQKVVSNDLTSFSAEEIDALRKELLREIFENPVLGEAWMRLVTSQKIADFYTIGDYWKTGANFIAEADKARSDGEGMNHWLRNDGEYYTSTDYQKSMAGLVMFLFSRQSRVETFTALPENHMHLIPQIGEAANSQRFATFADYEEALASLTFRFYLKNGKVGIVFGANLRDKRPEVLNPTTQSNPATVTNNGGKDNNAGKDKNAGKDNNAGKDKNAKKKKKAKPNPKDTPTTTEEQTTEQKTEEKKNPEASSLKQSEVPTQNDDSGPGPQKPDQGNSQSASVEESQYQQGESENTDGNDVTKYDQGPAADYTDGGAVPATKPIDSSATQANSHYVKPNSDGSPSQTPAPAGNNNGKMKSAPAVD